MARAPRKKQTPRYLRLQSSATARQIMEPAIERYLERSNISWDVSTHPSGLRTYFVPIGSETDYKAIVEGFKEPLVSDIPSLTHLFWSVDAEGFTPCGAVEQRVRGGNPEQDKPDGKKPRLRRRAAPVPSQHIDTDPPSRPARRRLSGSGKQATEQSGQNTKTKTRRRIRQ